MSITILSGKFSSFTTLLNKMIIKSKKQIIRADNPPASRIISRLKIHPCLAQDSQQSNISNLFTKNSSESKFDDTLRKRRKSQDQPAWRSKVQLKPIISRSTQKNLSRDDSVSLKSNRSDRKLLNLRSKSNQRKQKNLKNILSYEQSNEGVEKIKSILKQINQTQVKPQQCLDIEQQFYEQVRILQAFKELNRMTK